MDRCITDATFALLATALSYLILKNWIIRYYLFCRNTANNLVSPTNNYILISQSFFLKHSLFC